MRVSGLLAILLLLMLSITAVSISFKDSGSQVSAAEYRVKRMKPSEDSQSENEDSTTTETQRSSQESENSEETESEDTTSNSNGTGEESQEGSLSSDLKSSELSQSQSSQSAENDDESESGENSDSNSRSNDPGGDEDSQSDSTDQSESQGSSTSQSEPPESSQSTESVSGSSVSNSQSNSTGDEDENSEDSNEDTTSNSNGTGEESQEGSQSSDTDQLESSENSQSQSVSNSSQSAENDEFESGNSDSNSQSNSPGGDEDSQSDNTDQSESQGSSNSQSESSESSDENSEEASNEDTTSNSNGTGEESQEGSQSSDTQSSENSQSQSVSNSSQSAENDESESGNSDSNSQLNDPGGDEDSQSDSTDQSESQESSNSQSESSESSQSTESVSGSSVSNSQSNSTGDEDESSQSVSQSGTDSQNSDFEDSTDSQDNENSIDSQDGEESINSQEGEDSSGPSDCTATIVDSATNFTLPKAEIGTQISGECFEIYEGIWECKLVGGSAEWNNIECDVVDDNLMEALSPEAVSADPVSSVSAVVEAMNDGDILPNVAVQMTQRIVSQVVIDISHGSILVMSPHAMLMTLGELLTGTRALPINERAPVASDILVQLDTLALHVFDNPGYVDAGIIKMNVSETSFEGDLIGVSVDGNSIVLPGHEIRGYTGVSSGKIASFYFSNLTGILDDGQTINGSRVASPVISSAIQCGDDICNTMTAQFQSPVKITLKNSESGNTTRRSCVFWKIVSHQELISPYTGSWDEQGCTRNDEESTETHTVCECNHLTHFGILLSPGGADISPEHVFSLTVIGYVCVSISLVAMALTVLIHICFKSLWSLRSYVHIHLCLSLMAAQLLFVTAVNKTGNRILCSVIAIVLQYLFLTSFMWMLMEGVVLYVGLVKVFMGSKKKYIIGFTIMSYGLPALYLCLTVPLGFLVNGTWHYGNQEVCWLRDDTGFVWAFIVPVLLILMVNTGFFIMTLVVVYRHRKKKEKESMLKSGSHWLKCIVSLTVIMGLTWIVGVVTFHNSLLALVYIFTICVALQGLAIFIIFVPISDQVRDAFLKYLRHQVSRSEYLSDRLGTRIEQLMSREGRPQRFTVRSTTSSKPSTLTKQCISKLDASTTFPNPTYYEEALPTSSATENVYASLETIQADAKCTKEEIDSNLVYEEIDSGYFSKADLSARSSPPAANTVTPTTRQSESVTHPKVLKPCDNEFAKIGSYETRGFEATLNSVRHPKMLRVQDKDVFTKIGSYETQGFEVVLDNSFYDDCSSVLMS